MPDMRIDISGRRLLTIPPGRYTIGRGQTTHITLKHTSISRMHAILEFFEGKCCVIDVNSTNGTFLNGIRLTPSQRTKVKHGDTLKFGKGHWTFSVSLESASAPPPRELQTT